MSYIIRVISNRRLAKFLKLFWEEGFRNLGVYVRLLPFVFYYYYHFEKKEAVNFLYQLHAPDVI